MSLVKAVDVSHFATITEKQPTLATILAKYSGVRLALPSDNQRIYKFIDRHPMSEKKISLHSERGPDFFALTKARSDRTFTIIYENAAGEIKGVASMSYRNGYIDGRLESIGYLGDLRIAIDRHFVRHWKRLYAELVSTSPNLEETGYAKHYVTSVTEEDNLAKRTLVRNSIGGLAYNPLVAYRMVNIFRPRPWAKVKPLKKYTLEPLRQKCVEEAQSFLNKENSPRLFGEHNELLRRLQQWPQFTAENCTIVRDAKGEIRGMCGYWDNSMLKRTRIFYQSRELQMVSRFLSLPQDGSALRFMHMTNFCIDTSLPRKDREKIANALFDEGYRRLKSSSCQFLTFCEFTNERWRTALRRYFYITTPMKLYTVTGKPELVTTPELPPAFELAIL